MVLDLGDLKYETPANSIKTINMESVPTRIAEGMKKYEDTARGFELRGFELEIDDKQAGETSTSTGTIIISHRPPDEQVSQIYRLSLDSESTQPERLTHFKIEGGRIIAEFLPIVGDDWRGKECWRAGGSLMVMDLDGNEKFQLWRYWEDSSISESIAKIETELDNRPGRGRIERLTHDEYRYLGLHRSPSNKLVTFSSNKANNVDTLIYVMKLVDSNTGYKNDGKPMTVQSKLVTRDIWEGTTRLSVKSISVDDKQLLFTKEDSAAHRPLYLVDIDLSSSSDAPDPQRILLPNTTEKEEETSITAAQFSHDTSTPHLIYIITNAYGDFSSLVVYNTRDKTVLHVTTPESHLDSYRPIKWNVFDLELTSDYAYFRANVEGWNKLYVMPLKGAHANNVIEIRLDWEGGGIDYTANSRNGKPNEVALRLLSYRSKGAIARIQIDTALKDVKNDTTLEDGNNSLFISPEMNRYRNATAQQPEYRTLPPQLIKYKSFDGLEVPAMYYHPKDGNVAVPVVISIHGGPEGQSTSSSQIPIHWYLLNELGVAVIYPNVRGSSGYGKRYLALDEVEKREDSVKDIGALITYIEQNMKNELKSDAVAVMGGSYGGYMVFASMIHFSDKLKCGVANFGISHWVTFLENTAPHRRDARRLKYGDERKPPIREFFERISPLNNADKIKIPLQIAHGETDSRVPVGEALQMYKIVSKNGVHVELMLCEKEGHGFRQKSVIEYTNAAKIHFLERYLLVK